MITLSMNELFAGIGSQRKALLNIGVDVTVVGISEIDKYAVKSYEAMFGKTRNYGDISKIDKLDYADLWTYSFPCQDISIAGLKRGLVEGKTRSGLLYEVKRLLNTANNTNTLPKYLLLENVKALTQSKFKNDFFEWLKYLESLGYNNYWQILDAADYGIPQHRERVFVVSIRKDLHQTFEFPGKIPLTKCLGDFLENEVDDKYYLNLEQVIKRINCNYKKDSVILSGNGLCATLLASDYSSVKCVQIPKLKNMKWDSYSRIHSILNVSLTLNTCQGGNTEVKISLEDNNFRELTPKEYWRLMGFTDGDYEKCAKLNSSNQMYKQGGNSIVVNVLEAIFKNLFIDKTTTQSTLF